MNITEVVKRLKRPRVLVAGDLLLDQYIFGNVTRISPEAPIPVVHVGREEYRLGGAANVAWNISALGARVSAAGVVGKDTHGVALKKLLKNAGIQTMSIVTDAKKPTCTKTRVIAHHQQMLRVDREEAAPLRGAAERALASVARRAAKKAEIIVVSDYQKGTLSPRVCRALIQSKVPIIVGLKGGEIAKYKGAIGASLNQAELLALTKEKTLAKAALGSPQLIAKAAKEILQKLQLQFLIVTLGERGIVVFSNNDETIELPTVAQEVYDVTGAGDTVLAAFAVAYSSGLSLVECARIANTAAGIVVGKIGTAVATRKEIVAHLQGDEEAHVRKVLKESALLRVLRQERKRGKTIVFTNGCFDILHAGHTNLLERAKNEGDILVVGLNSDDSIRRLKGKTRPIMAHDERAHVLAALEAVDYIVTFGENTPHELIKKIRPDVLVKGEDWKGKRVVGREFAGRVMLAPILAGKSTTDVIERITGWHSYLSVSSVRANRKR